MAYRCEVTTVEGFIQQLAVSYLRHGYLFYVSGRIPEAKNPQHVDAKLIAKYGINISKWARVRRKHNGLANMQYLRHQRFFVLMATHGSHRFFEDEAQCLHDARRQPIRYAGYAVSLRANHPHVRLDECWFRQLSAYFTEAAVHHDVEWIAAELRSSNVQAYAPVRRQLLTLLRSINDFRETAGMPQVPFDVLPLRRRVVRPFDSQDRGITTSAVEPHALPQPTTPLRMTPNPLSECAHSERQTDAV
jgi:hypothetical protein